MTMITFIDIAAWFMAVAWCVPAAVFATECIAACLLARPVARRSPSTRPSVAVLIPAHDEAAAIEPTLRRLRGRLRAGDRVLVVADNCSDDTAERARQGGAEVTERTDPHRRGKGFALAHGLDVLAQCPPDVVFVLDADCRTGPGTVRTVAELAFSSGRPVQSLNLCSADCRGLQSIAEFNLRIKNLVRPLGLAKLGLPCHLMGTGMALPWRSVERLPPLGEDLAEDMRLGVDLALAGVPTLFCTSARVESGLPADAAGLLAQRTRWEQGHLRTLLSHAPRLISMGLRRYRVDILGLGLDLLVPPITFLVFLWFILAASTALVWTLGASAGPLILLAVAGGGFTGSLALAWYVFCRRRVPLAALAAIPGFMLRKLPIYAGFLIGRGQTRWVRTPRAADNRELAGST